MIARRVAALAVVLAAAVLAVVLLQSSGSSYVIKMSLADAAGLRQGSPVSIGGQDVGTISMTVHNARVLVSMKLNRAYAPVGRDATASVASLNLLGQKRIELNKGDVRHPAASGYLLPASQVSVTADLDQVLDVLSPDVRTRLGILVNEAGQAFTGRRADFSQMLEQLPGDFNAGTSLLNGIAADNHTLADLVQTSDGFVTQLAQQRSQLNHAIDVLGQASSTVQARRAQLAETLSKAPQTLTTLQTFLSKLQNTTVPLGPAARDITAAAPELSATLAQLNPFRQAADPTLREATTVAPALTRLATGATPVVQRATPVAASLAAFSAALVPMTQIVNRSADNLVAILQNWSRAIQFRDGLSHVFRGEATMTPQTLTSMINQLQQAGVLGSLETAAKRTANAANAARPKADGAKPAAKAPSPNHAASKSSPSNANAAPEAGGPSVTTPSRTGTSPAPGSPSLATLLSYLLKP